MWGAVVLLAVVSIPDPIRVGITAILVSRPRPLVRLVAYWLGLMATAVGLALFVLLFLPEHVAPLTEAVLSATHHPAVPPAQITLGVLALGAAAAIAVRSGARRPESVSVGAGSATVLEDGRPRGLGRFSWPALLEGGRGDSLGVAFAAGLCSATPPIEYCLLLVAVVASGAALGTQISAIVLFAVLAFVVAEIPLLSYWAAPSKTQQVVTKLQLWMQAYRSRILVTALGVFGILMVFHGSSAL